MTGFTGLLSSPILYRIRRVASVTHHQTRRVASPTHHQALRATSFPPVWCT